MSMYSTRVLPCELDPVRGFCTEQLVVIVFSALLAFAGTPTAADALTCTFSETWSHATIKSYSSGQTIAPDDPSRFTQGWFAQRDPECSDLVQITSDRVLSLTRTCENGDPDSTLYAAALLKPLALNSTSQFTFRETGTLTSPNSLSANSIELLICPSSGQCRVLTYVLQRDDDYEVGDSASARAVLLPPDLVKYSRNLYSDFLEAFGYPPADWSVTGIGLNVEAFSASGSATFDDITLCGGAEAAPSAPAALVASAVSSMEIDLSWEDTSANETGFKVERKTDLSGNYAQIATAKAQQTSYADKSAAPDTTYSYRVRAYNGAGDSGFSNQAHARTTPAALCGDADRNGSITTNDALRVLKKAVGSSIECPLDVCDTDASGSVLTSDALRVLRKAVGQTIVLTCPGQEHATRRA